MILIRPARMRDLNVLKSLFENSINNVDRNIYSESQIQKWIQKGLEDDEIWINKLSNQYFLIYELQKEILGFASINSDGFVDMFYVKGDQQNKGIGSMLYFWIEKYAHQLKMTKLTSNVSLSAHQFFVKNGFKDVEKIKNDIDGITLENMNMVKSLV